MTNRDDNRLAERFEEHRPHLGAVAYRMLGSRSEADDAVQEAWLHLDRLDRAEIAEVRNLGGWLTTVVARICLDLLRSRRSRREEPLEPDTYVRVPDLVVRSVTDLDPEQAAVQSDSVGLALLVVLDTLAPAERLAFVLHDMFAVPFDEIAPVVERSPAATRQLASRARRRVQEANPPSAAGGRADLARQREVVDAWLAASRAGDFDALLTLLDPNVVLRVDLGAAGGKVVRGARAVVGEAKAFAWAAEFARPALVDDTVGIVTVTGERTVSVTALTLRDDRITQIVILADPERLALLDLPATDRPA